MSEHNGSTKSPTQRASRNLADLAHDSVTLAELQAELFNTEAKQGLHGLMAPAALLAAAVSIGLGIVPVLLLSLAYGLVELAQWSLPLSLLVAALVGAIVAGVAATVAIQKVRNGAMALRRSRDELSRNVAWIKRVLKQKANPARSD